VSIPKIYTPIKADQNSIVMLPWVVGEEYAGAQMPLMVRSIHE
jgi:hypothetical protein